VARAGWTHRAFTAAARFRVAVLEQAVSYELQGEASLELAPEGVRYEITAPLRELVERT
jgi:hypothetical protein